MNKQLLIGIGAVLVIGAGYFLYQQTALNPSKNQTGAGAIKGNLQDLFAKGVSMQCSFSNDDQENKSEGTVYLSGKKMAGSFTSTQTDGTVYKSNLIRDDQYGYSWLDGQTQGTKLKIEASKDVMKNSDNEKPNKVFALENEKINYDCKPWNVDKSIFVPPADIEFQDISMQVEESKKTTEQLKESQCASCNQVPAGTSREQCLQAFECN